MFLNLRAALAALFICTYIVKVSVEINTDNITFSSFQIVCFYSLLNLKNQS